MSYVTCIGYCICCGQIFEYNPLRVPSTTVFTGEREPVCLDCFAELNRQRIIRGETPFPMARDAYDPCDESEL